MGKGAKGRTPNDQRSDALNPNSPAFKAGSDNRGNQLNPNSPPYRSSREKPKADEDE